MARPARLIALLTLLVLAGTFWVHAAGASTSLPCYGRIVLESDHGHVTNPACKGAHSVVATVQGVGNESVWVTVAHVAPTGVVSVHISGGVQGEQVAYTAW